MSEGFAMKDLSLVSRVSLYALLALMGMFALLVGVWQAKVLRGRAMKNPDGSTDDWRVQKTHYGLAFADLVLACPAGVLGILISPK